KLEMDRVRQRVLRYAASEPGAELIRQSSVMTSLSEIRLALAQVSDMKRLLEEEAEVPLSGVHPVASALQRSGIEGAVLLPRELLQVGSTLRAARVARGLLAKRKEASPLLWEIGEPLHTDKVLEFNIEQAIDESGAVKTTASRELQAVRRSIAEKSAQLRKRLESILREVSDLGFSQEEIITTREGRMVIPVKAEHKNRVPGFIQSASSSGATVFVEPTETLEVNNEIRSLQFEEQREVDRILRGLTDQVRKARADLLDDLQILARLDALQARARYSIEVLGIEPQLSDDGPLRLVGARHPVLLINHGYAGTVPLDLELGGAFTTLVISGPNAGGKSVAMKCVGLLTLMAQIGLHIPAAEGTRLRVFTSMFVDIGDEQSIENDLSTFSSHLRNLKAIAAGADARSLVLIDEIGSGTDPAEGGAIAAAVLEWLTRKGAYTIATTHHSALKVFAHDTDGVENGAMEFDQATLTPTYRFRSGIPGSSYALEMAARLGFPVEVLGRSRAYLGQQQVRLDTLIAELEASEQRTRQQADAVAREKAVLDKMVTEYEARMAALSAEARELKRHAVEEATGIVEKANAAIERSVREIKEAGAEKESVRGAHRRVEQVRRELAAERKEIGASEPEPAPAVLEVGGLVTMGRGTDTGEVLAIAPDG
ncbi:MAG TPA: endonuclease MutS2, partial [Bacteroidota bacterium]